MKKLAPLFFIFSLLLAISEAHAAPSSAQSAALRGRQAYDAKDYKSAVENYTTAISEEPGNGTFFNNRALAHIKLGDLKKALDDFNKAATLSPNDLTVLMNRSGVFHSLGQIDKATDDLTTVLQRDPRNPEAYNVRGLLRDEAGDSANAIADLTKAISIATTQSVYRINRGVIYTGMGDWAKATEDFEAAVQFDAKNAKARLWRARAYLQKNKFAAALADADLALALDPTETGALSARARALHGTGQFEKAVAGYEQALQSEPGRLLLLLNLSRAKRREPLGGAAPGNSGNAEPPLPREGEIRLTGNVKSVDTAKGTLVMEAALFTLPSGKTGKLPAVKAKTIRVAKDTQLFPFTGFGVAGTLADIQPGVLAFVVGTDAGSGAELPARWLGAMQVLPATPAVDAAPRLAPNAVGRPSFTRKDGTTWSAGTAFAAQLGFGPPMLLTALHLFGPSGGLKEVIAPEKIGDEVTEVKLQVFGGTRTVATAQGALLKSGTSIGKKPGDYSGDLMAFKLAEQSGAEPLPLAAETPPPGTQVWVAGRAINEKSAAGGFLLYPAEVLNSSPKILVIALRKNLPGTAFSGAPAVNAKGEVVGMMLAGAELDGASLFYCNPVGAMRERLTVKE